MSNKVAAIIEIHTQEYDRHITFGVNDVFDNEELNWRLGLAIKQLKKDLVYFSKYPPKVAPSPNTEQVEQNRWRRMADQELKQSLIDYLLNNPDERLWQAIRNWSGHPFIFVAKDLDGPYEDTFYWEDEKAEGTS